MDKPCKPELCTGCGACAAICPADCIRMEPDAEGFLQPVLDSGKCIACNRCQQVCPLLNMTSPGSSQAAAYAAINVDEPVRLHSTSGGIFSLLCRWVLERGGIVFGAAYDSNFNVIHCPVESSDELHKLRGAKYAQSSLGNTYKQVKDCLNDGKYVLFSGTPCQVGGLVSFLRKPYDRLILVDLICHGVPSPKVWQHYISYRSGQDADGQKPADINLRSKETGWPGYSIRFDYPNGQYYSALNSQDPYLRGFVGNLYLRSSCYHCHFKGTARQSDFTLGDYWGVWSQLPEYHDGKGTSLILMHSEKANAIWNDLSTALRFSEVDTDRALKENPSALTVPAYHQTRSSFFSRYQTEDFSCLVEELYPRPIVKKASLLQRAVRKIRRIING